MDTVKGRATQVWIIGIDEVGRGPLAGPVTIAAVAAMVNYESGIMNYGLKNIRDSKRLSSKQREGWDKIIRKNFPCTISSVSHSVIDKNGIRWACSVAVMRSLRKLLKAFPIIHNSRFIILLDGGLAAPPAYKNQQTIIKGDERVPLIAAASIVAKVHRDRYMTRLHHTYPRYGFERNKGYGTAEHRESIARFGLTPHHRRTFNGCVQNG